MRDAARAPRRAKMEPVSRTPPCSPREVSGAEVMGRDDVCSIFVVRAPVVQKTAVAAMELEYWDSWSEDLRICY